MMNGEIILTRANLPHIGQLSNLILDCKKFSDIAPIYHEIGGLLLDDIDSLDLDEDIMNISRFAVGLAVEISPVLMAREMQKEKHWQWRPVVNKMAGQRNPMHDVRPKEKQIAGMMSVIIYQLKNDPAFRESALILEEYQRKHSLWTADDEPGIEV